MGKWKIYYRALFIVGLLFLVAGVLVPTVSTGCGGRSAEVAAIRSQYSNYVTALKMFKGEYGKFPDFMEGRSEINLSTYPDSEYFIEAISGRTKYGERSQAHGNYRGISFHSFSKPEIIKAEVFGYRQIVDRTGNINLVVCIDHDGDGIIEVLDDSQVKTIRTRVTMYSIPREGEPAIKLWD